MEERNSTTEKSVYINAFLRSADSAYSLTITMLMIAFFGPLYLYYLALKAEDFQLTWTIIAITLLIGLLMAFIVGVFLIYRKYWVTKIIANNTGLYYYGFFKKLHISWDDILSIDVPPMWFSFLGKLSKVRTKKETIYFPLTMKRKDEKYPKLNIGFHESKWIDANGIEKPITLENCPLYVEIQKHLKG